MAKNAAAAAVYYETNALPKFQKDQTFQLMHNKSDLRRSLRFNTVSRRLGRQSTVHIQLIWAGFLIIVSNIFIRPLTAGHILNRDQHLTLEMSSQKDVENEGPKLQSRYYGRQDVYSHWRQRRATENVDEDSINLNLKDELNCTPRAVEQFPDNFLSHDFVTHGGVVFNILISIYMFFGLALVCDDYFVPSLIQLRDVLHISLDISGATFMAIGSSIPELFTSIIGVIVAKSDVGVGTIAGSAIFNILFIMGFCALVSSVNLVMSWWPVFRDSFAYMISILVLVFVLMDDRIYWYEALSMLFLYCLYIVMLLFNTTLEAKAKEVVNGVLGYYLVSSSEKQHLIDSQKLMSSYLSRDAVETSTELSDHKRGQLWKTTPARFEQTSLSNIEEEPNSDTDEVNFQSTLAFPPTLAQRIFWFLMLPLKLILYLTIPDSRRPSCHRFCVCTFILSIIWIAILSYVMVWMATVAGDALNIPDTVIGFTILATGTSIPDCLASYLVAKDGHADMAFANSVGSNIFDILVCLGLPWIIQAGINSGDGVLVHSHGLTYSILILLITVFLFFASLLISNWTLNRVHGYFFMGLYAIIIIIVCLYEMNYFGPLNPPPCPR